MPTKHGLSRTLEYRSWQQMRLRCLNPRHKAYPNYGGRGISVCARWLESPINFYEDMGPKPTPLHELDRIDNDGNYEPGNCRWTSRSRNSRNRRSTTYIEFRGKVHSVPDLCEQFSISQDAARWRLKQGWSAEEVFTVPMRNYPRKAA